MKTGNLKTGKTRSINAAARRIKMLILDVDGVLTDGSIILDNKGNEYKTFHVRDGHGIKMLMKAGVMVALITGRYSKVVARRADELGITEVFQKCRDKTSVYTSLLEKHSLSHHEVAYVGDDIVDAPIMAKVGFPVSVSDSAEELKEYSLLITQRRGGKGAVREVADIILKAKGVWGRIFDEYFET